MFSMGYSCQLKNKKEHDQNIESYVLFGGQNWERKPRAVRLRELWATAPKRQAGSQDIGVFAAKIQVVGTSKIAVNQIKPDI